MVNLNCNSCLKKKEEEMNDNNESQTKVVSILLIYCLSCLNEQSKNDLTDGHTNERQGSN